MRRQDNYEFEKHDFEYFGEQTVSQNFDFEWHPANGSGKLEVSIKGVACRVRHALRFNDFLKYHTPPLRQGGQGMSFAHVCIIHFGNLLWGRSF